MIYIHKLCAKCNESKLANTDNFYKAKQTKDGWHPWCKPCAREYSNKRFKSMTKEEQREYDRIKYQKRKEKHQAKCMEWFENNKDRWKEYAKEYQQSENGKEKFRRYSSNRRALKMHLPNTLTEELMLDYKTYCIGDPETAELDHFIPLSWGHGGTYIGNIYFLSKEININKRNKNPIKWMKSKAALKFAPKEQWDVLIYTMAFTNGLTVPEFIEFINWCEQNKRTVEQIKADGDITSLELWKRSKSL